MFGQFAPRRRKSMLSFGVSRNALEMLEVRVLLSGVTDHDHEESGLHYAPLAVIDESLEIHSVSANSSIAAWNFDTSDAFRLHSKPDSNFKIYLDFNGQVVTGTIWNTADNIPTITNVGYDFDGDTTTFSAAERSAIIRAWQMVAEDFAGFDVDITTEEPPIDQLIRSGGGDSSWGVRVIMTDAFGSSVGTGGVAYLTSFNWDSDTPAYVYNGVRNGSNGAIWAMAETISHEVGHTLGLNHDGLRTGPTEYYSGHGTGPEGWGPIMGAPFSKTTTQWSNGNYFDASRQEDDLAIITSQNGFTYRQDDYGNTRGGATAIVPVNGTDIGVTGIIEQNTDIDYIRFEAGNGPATFTITNYSERPNLNVFAAIYDATGTLIASANPKDNPGATLSANLTTGTYYLRIEGVGSDGVYSAATDAVTDPANGPWTVANPLGFSDYGSIGLYAITGTVVSARADFGDAPDTYGTLEASDGPRHLEVGPILGSLRDSELDATPNLNASGDGDDEDGVKFLQSLSPGRTSNISISSITGGFVDAWIDFNANGTFDAAEQIATNLAVGIGTTLVSVTVPVDAVLGSTYARFRIAAVEADVTGPTGKASNGEVEDYRLNLKPAQMINEVLFNVPGDDTGKEYIELRSTPGTVIENGTYFVVVEGDGNGGTIDMIYDLSGMTYGSNGYIVLLQKNSPYIGLVDPSSTVRVSTQAGWRDQGAKVSILGFSENNFEDGSQTYMLVKAPNRPLLGGDIDANNDGTPDGAIFANWDVIDSAGFIDGGAGDQVYGAVNFRTNGVGLVPAGSTSIILGSTPIDYIGRNLISQGPAINGWLGGNIAAGVGPIWSLTGANPVTFNGRPLDHFGSLNFDQLDFGDLPNSYLTTEAVGGASHGVGGPILGTGKDVESDGKPSANADLDDSTSSDDEDGVTIPSLREGTAGTVAIVIGNVTAGATVQGWFDWNGNGNFNDAGEAVISQVVTANGTFNFNITAPLGSFDATNGTTYARFRVSTAGGLGSAGAAVDGEVEDYKLSITTSAVDDFGDAPDTYGTTLAANGARHEGVGPTLGAGRDIERDGIPSANATGDDAFKLDDEDGVFILTAISPGFTSIAVVNAPTGGVLDAWLDLNRNGRFDTNEQVMTNVVLTPGDNNVNFAVPAGALVGKTFARFRVATAAGDVTGPTGPATNGEVEDYQVDILPIFNRPPQLTGGPFAIDENSPNGTVVGTVTATDPDPGQALTYAITKGNFGSAFKINPTTGEITVAATEWVDYEIQTRFDLEVTVTDNGNPKLSTTSIVVVNLNNLPDRLSLLVREGDAVGTRFGRVQSSLTTFPLTFEIVNGNEGNAFTINPDGIISVANSAPLDFETHPVFELEVFVTDSNSNAEQVFVTVKVLDRNESPQSSDFVFSVSQGAANGATVGQVVATDPDANQVLSYAIFRGDESGAFAIDQQGNITVADTTKLNFSTQPIYDLIVSISDSAEIPYTISSKVRIYVRTNAYTNNFNSGVLGPNWVTSGNSVAVSQPAVATSPKLVLQQSGAAAQNLSATLEVELRSFDDLMFQFHRTVLTAGAKGQVQVSDDGGTTWFTINSFDGAVNPVGTEQRVLINLTQAARNAGREIRGRTLIRFTAQTSAVGSGVCIDNVLITGRIREATPTDVLIYDQTTNSFKLGFSNGERFVFSTSPWLPGSNWEFVYGDFNNDQRLDVAGFDAGAKRWVVGLSTGSALVVKQWTNLNNSIDWQNFVVGDFNGDGFDDVAAQTPTGQVWIGYSNGARFVNKLGTTWDAGGWAQVLAGDVDGDGKDDLIGRRNDGTLAVGLGKDGQAGFNLLSQGGTFGSASWDDVLLGDFNGDGKLDLVGRKKVTAPATAAELKTSGQIWIGKFQQNKFVFSYATRWNAAETWANVLVADVNSDGLDDLVGVTSSGAYWGAVSNGNTMVNRFLGTSTADPTQTVVGDFNRDGHDDLATFYSSHNEWIVGLGGGTRAVFNSFGNLPLMNLFKKAGSGNLD